MTILYERPPSLSSFNTSTQVDLCAHFHSKLCEWRRSYTTGPGIVCLFHCQLQIVLWRPSVRQPDKPAMLSLCTQPTQYALWCHGQISCPQLHWHSILYFLSLKTSPSSQRFLTISTLLASQPTCAFPTEVQVEEQWQKVHWLVSITASSVLLSHPRLRPYADLSIDGFQQTATCTYLILIASNNGARARTISQPLTILSHVNVSPVPICKERSSNLFKITANKPIPVLASIPLCAMLSRPYLKNRSLVFLVVLHLWGFVCQSTSIYGSILGGFANPQSINVIFAGTACKCTIFAEIAAPFANIPNQQTSTSTAYW